VTLPVYALNAAGEERCEWLVPGMLKDKLVALAKTLPQRPRSRLVPLPDYAEAFIARHPFADGSLLDVLTANVRATSGIDIRRADFKHEQLAPHLLMNLRVVDEHGRQLGESRHLAELKASLGGQARSAFQALAALRLPAAGLAPAATPSSGTGSRFASGRRARGEPPRLGTAGEGAACARCRDVHRVDLRRAARAHGGEERRTGADRLPGADRQGRTC
jgi:ATP-dependent helicase HrpA